MGSDRRSIHSTEAGTVTLSSPMLTYLSRYHAELSGAGARQAESHAYRGASTEIRVALAIQSTARTIDRRKESQESSAGVAFGFKGRGGSREASKTV